MVYYIGQDRGTRFPLSNHHTYPIETVTLSLPQTAISYADRQNLGFSEWDEPRGGWILYTTRFPSDWREFVKVVEERLKLDSKRGKGSKKVDSNRSGPPHTTLKQKSKSAVKTPSKQPKVSMNRSMASPSKLENRSSTIPGTLKKSTTDTSKA